jgi:hypothetical protein
MSNLNEILAGYPRDVVLEAIYLATHELTCSTRLQLESVLQNRALDKAGARQAIGLAEEIVNWSEAHERKPLADFLDRERAKILRKLRVYRREHLIEMSDHLIDVARERLGRIAA